MVSKAQTIRDYRRPAGLMSVVEENGDIELMDTFLFISVYFTHITSMHTCILIITAKHTLVHKRINIHRHTLHREYNGSAINLLKDTWHFQVLQARRKVVIYTLIILNITVNTMYM